MSIGPFLDLAEFGIRAGLVIVLAILVVKKALGERLAVLTDVRSLAAFPSPVNGARTTIRWVVRQRMSLAALVVDTIRDAAIVLHDIIDVLVGEVAIGRLLPAMFGVSTGLFHTDESFTPIVSIHDMAVYTEFAPRKAEWIAVFQAFDGIGCGSLRRIQSDQHKIIVCLNGLAVEKIIQSK